MQEEEEASVISVWLLLLFVQQCPPIIDWDSGMTRDGGIRTAQMIQLVLSVAEVTE